MKILHAFANSGSVLIACLFALAPAVLAEEVEIKNEQGVAIKVTVLALGEDSVTVSRADGKKFEIALSKLDDASVEFLKAWEAKAEAAKLAERAKLRLEKEKAEAEKLSRIAADHARIPDFPANPKSPDDLPQKVAIEPRTGGKRYITLTKVQEHFIDPKLARSDPGNSPHLSVGIGFGGGEAMAVFTQNLSTRTLKVKYLMRMEGEDTYSGPNEVAIASNAPKEEGGGIRLGFFSKKLPGNLEEIVFYDFREIEAEE